MVLKIGSSSIVRPDGLVRLGFLGRLVTTVAQLRQQDVSVVLITSGAIAMGTLQMRMPGRPTRIPDKQACAAVGQGALMALYQQLFTTVQLRVGQVLLTREDLQDRRRYLNARETLTRLLSLGVIPIINENDSVAVEEIQFGDNDMLSAMVAGLINADLLVLFTDVDGIYDVDPRLRADAKVIPMLEGPLDDLLNRVNENTSDHGTGGIRSKLMAGQLCRQFGIPCLITRGKAETLSKLLAGETAGTFIVPQARKSDSRARWLAKAAAVQGTLILDNGACAAVCEGGKSLLPSGIRGVEGDFVRGAVVNLVGPRRQKIGRGISRYAAEDLHKIAGMQSDQIEQMLGYTFGDEVIHRDDLVLNN